MKEGRIEARKKCFMITIQRDPITSYEKQKLKQMNDVIDDDMGRI